MIIIYHIFHLNCKEQIPCDLCCSHYQTIRSGSREELGLLFKCRLTSNKTVTDYDCKNLRIPPKIFVGSTSPGKETLFIVI